MKRTILRRAFRAAAAAALCGLTVTVTVAVAQPARLTADRLKQLKATSNDPFGDAFVDSRERLSQLIDAFAADSSQASPVYLYLAAKTAHNLGRVEDAAFLFYAAQLRKAFDFQRYNASAQPDGNNAATYLAFLNHTIGEWVNPAVMRQPKLFASAIARIEKWEMVPSPDAYYPEFAEAKGFKLKQPEWAAAARTIKDQFMTQFGRRMTTLLNDRQYFEAFSYVQKVNLGEVDITAPETESRFKKSMEAMDAAEQRLFGGAGGAAPPAAGPSAKSQPPAAAPAPTERPNTSGAVRVGGEVKAPKALRKVNPKFPRGAEGAVILEVTVGAAGRVVDVRTLVGDPALVAVADAALREWVFEPVIVDGRPVAVIQTMSFIAR